MRLKPQCASNICWIDTGSAPPGGLIAAAVHLAMMTPAQRYGELIADLPAERSALYETEVVSVGRLPSADQTGARTNKFDVIAVTDPTRLRQSEDALVDRLRPRALLRRLRALQPAVDWIAQPELVISPRPQVPSAGLQRLLPLVGHQLQSVCSSHRGSDAPTVRHHRRSQDFPVPQSDDHAILAMLRARAFP